MKKIFVLHLHTLPWISGSGLNTFYSMKYLDAARYKSALASSSPGRLEELTKKHGFEFYPLKHLKAPVSPLHDLLAIFEIRNLLKKLKPDILHTHNSKAGFLGRLSARFLPGIKIVHTVHGFSFHDRESPLRRIFFKQLERIAFPWADAVIAISEELADWGAREGIGKKEDYRIVWSGIEIEKFKDADRSEGRKILKLDDDDIAVGLVAKLWEGKGHNFLIEVMDSLINEKVKLVFIGEGYLEKELKSKVSKMGAKGRSVIFAGFHEDTAAITKALDIAVLPSDFEGMGRVLLEAQAAGVPVMANRVGGIKNVVTDGGILLERNDTEGWKKALMRLIEDEEERKKFGSAGQKFVTEKFSIQKMVKELEKIYEDILVASSNRTKSHATQ